MSSSRLELFPKNQQGHREQSDRQGSDMQLLTEQMMDFRERVLLISLLEGQFSSGTSS